MGFVSATPETLEVARRSWLWAEQTLGTDVVGHLLTASSASLLLFQPQAMLGSGSDTAATEQGVWGAGELGSHCHRA